MALVVKELLGQAEQLIELPVNEIEVGFGNLNPRIFERLKKLGPATEQKLVDTNWNLPSKEGIFRTIRTRRNILTDQVETIKKTKIKDTSLTDNFSDYGFSLSFANESNSKVPTVKYNYRYQKTRWTILLQDGVSLMLDQINETPGSKYRYRYRAELEIDDQDKISQLTYLTEYIWGIINEAIETVTAKGAQRAVNLGQVYHLSQRRKALFQLNLLFQNSSSDSVEYYHQVVEKSQQLEGVKEGPLSRYLDIQHLTESRSLQYSDLSPGPNNIIFGPLDYSVTIKADGERRILYHNEDGIWSIFRSSVQLLVSSDQLASQEETFVGTVIYVERVAQRVNDPDNIPVTKVNYVVLDILFYRAIDLRTNNLFKRLTVETRDNQNYQFSDVGGFKEYFNNLMEASGSVISTKSFLSLKVDPSQEKNDRARVNHFFEQLNLIFEKLDNAVYPTDGLMFVPINGPFNTTRTKHRPDRRTLKWKPLTQNTIDFRYHQTKNCLEYLDDRGNYRCFQGTRNHPISSDLQQLLDLNGHQITDLSIIEVGFDPDDQDLKVIRARPDKQKPNTELVAKSNWDLIFDPITRQTLTGQDIRLMRKYHNRIKSDLFNSVRESVILDIGSGRGGDVNKWKQAKLKHVFAVEPNRAHLKELRNRLKKAKIENRVTIINSGGQETDKITRVVKKKYPQGVDHVSLMLSMSFFWENKRMVQQLSETIRSVLKPGGTVIFLTISGSGLRNLLTPHNGPQIKVTEKQPSLQFANVSLWSLPNQSIKIDIDGTIVEDQIEYYVDISDLGGEPEVAFADNTQQLLDQWIYRFSKAYIYGRIKFDSKMNDSPVTTKRKTGSKGKEKAEPKRKTGSKEKAEPKGCAKPSPLPVSRYLSRYQYLNKGHLTGSTSIRDKTFYSLKTLGSNNNCMLHAILQLVSAEYRRGSEQKKERLTTTVSRDIAVLLGYDVKDSHYNLWSFVAEALFPPVLLRQIIALSQVQRREVTATLESFSDILYTPYGIASLLDSSTTWEESFLTMFADLFGLNIISLAQSDGNVSQQGSSPYHKDRPTIAIINSDNLHYESLALSVSETKIKTIFDDKLVQQVFGPIDDQPTPDREQMAIYKLVEIIYSLFKDGSIDLEYLSYFILTMDNQVFLNQKGHLEYYGFARLVNFALQLYHRLSRNNEEDIFKFLYDYQINERGSRIITGYRYQIVNFEWLDPLVKSRHNQLKVPLSKPKNWNL